MDKLEILELLSELTSKWDDKIEYYKKPSSGWATDAVRNCKSDLEAAMIKIMKP